MAAALSRRVAALEASRTGALGTSSADHWREATREALRRLGRAGEAEARAGPSPASPGRADGDRELAALATRLFMERQGWTYCPGDERL
jgi:hypothetical protein